MFLSDALETEAHSLIFSDPPRSARLMAYAAEAAAMQKTVATMSGIVEDFTADTMSQAPEPARVLHFKRRA